MLRLQAELAMGTEIATPKFNLDDIDFEKINGWIFNDYTIGVDGVNCDCYKLKNIAAIVTYINGHLPEVTVLNKMCRFSLS